MTKMHVIVHQPWLQVQVTPGWLFSLGFHAHFAGWRHHHLDLHLFWLEVLIGRWEWQVED